MYNGSDTIYDLSLDVFRCNFDGSCLCFEGVGCRSKLENKHYKLLREWSRLRCKKKFGWDWKNSVVVWNCDWICLPLSEEIGFNDDTSRAQERFVGGNNCTQMDLRKRLY